RDALARGLPPSVRHALRACGERERPRQPPGRQADHPELGGGLRGPDGGGAPADPAGGVADRQVRGLQRPPRHLDDQVLRGRGHARRDRQGAAGARLPGLLHRHAAGADVPLVARRPHLRRARRGAPGHRGQAPAPPVPAGRGAHRARAHAPRGRPAAVPGPARAAHGEHVTANAHPGAAGTATEPERLASWLRDRLGLPADRVSLTPLTGGNSNETVLVSAGDRRFVLRRPPRDPLAPSAHDMGREHRLLRALARTDVPAPRPVAYCADPEVIGAPFLLMEFIADGVSLTDRLPPAYAGAPDAVGELGRGMVRALATLHRVDWRAAGLEGFGRPQGFLARQVGRWRAQLDRYRVRPLPLFEEIAAWLERNRPEE